ncbi:MAG TPA: AmmeMemoRadiSam system radical SAM enzyme [Desulfomonilaceae bacterium]|nr:AmmeMemoRadiSam system radical SAM enzyme [Desulfomonilaceae bacterium]
MKEALLYDKLDSGEVDCRLCRHRCKIKEGKKGLCSVRQNKEGILYTLVYDKVVSANLDPIEKKPLFHFAPGTRSFSIATVGCNFFCSFCQNYSISQMPRDKGRIVGEDYHPADIVAMAMESDCRSISYTYTEPTIYYELARDTMVEAQKKGLLNVFVTNGYMTRDMLDDCKGLMDAANVDLKAFNDRFYSQYCKAKRAGVMDSLVYMKQLGIWLEVTTLLIPSLNDKPEEIKDMAEFIRDELGPETPWHVSRFYPQYKEQTLPPTDVQELRNVRRIGLEAGLHYVYIGNVPHDPGEKTYCPGCASVLIDRVGYSIGKYALKDGMCPKCGFRLDGVAL